MNHKQVKDCCEGLGLTVRQEPCPIACNAFSATLPGIRVYWKASRETGYLVGLPRVASHGADTHARTLSEIQFLVRQP